MTMPTTAANAVAHMDLANVPKSSALRLYNPETQGNSFSLDGFPSVPAGGDWLARLVEVIEQQGAVSMTTNQTLFRQLTEAGALDDRLRALKAQDLSTKEIYWTLYNEAATQAARAFGEVYNRWPWDGRVSQEASALLTDLDPLVSDVQRIAKAMTGVGAFTKVPNVKVGPRALRRVVAQYDPTFQVHPNVTLVFSDRHYLETVEGYLLGLGDRVKAMQAAGCSTEEIRKDLDRIYSVNSLFVSRVDRVVDPMIGEGHSLLKGKTALAQAKKIYEMFEAIFLGRSFQDPLSLYADLEGKLMLERIQHLKDLFATLKSFGAHPQRLLIASSGVKSDQPYSALLYVLPFLGPWSANTMPEGTLKALSQFVSGLSDDEVAVLRGRNLMRESLPAIPADVTPREKWDETLLMTAEERRRAGIHDVTADEILKEVRDQVLKPAGTSLRVICDTLRDKGASSFTADEEQTLQTIQSKLQVL